MILQLVSPNFAAGDSADQSACYTEPFAEAPLPWLVSDCPAYSQQVSQQNFQAISGIHRQALQGQMRVYRTGNSTVA